MDDTIQYTDLRTDETLVNIMNDNSENRFQTCNRRVVQKLKSWHVHCISVFSIVVLIIIVIIIIIVQLSSSVSDDQFDLQADDPNITCSGSLFNGTFEWEYETIRNIDWIQATEQKLAKILNSSDLSSCFCHAKVQSLGNTTVAFQLEFLPLKDNKESMCQTVDLDSLYYVLNEYIQNQEGNDTLKIKHSSLGIQEVQ